MRESLSSSKLLLVMVVYPSLKTVSKLTRLREGGKEMHRREKSRGVLLRADVSSVGPRLFSLPPSLSPFEWEPHCHIGKSSVLSQALFTLSLEFGLVEYDFCLP